MEDDAKENVAKKQKKMKKLENNDRRSPSPPAQPSKTIMSKPKSIIRNTGKSTAPPGSSGAGFTSPKRSVGFPGLSSISEEEKSTAPQLAENGISSKGPLETVDSGTSIELAPRRRVTMSATEFDRPTSKKMSVSGEAEDVLGEKEDFVTMRSRVSTVSSSTGRYKEIGRKNSRQLKEEAAKLSERAVNFRRGGRKVTGLEFISPDMELKIREKICRAIGERYGGLARANRAATTIQTAYRQYKLKKRYDEIRKEASTLRQRAKSMTNPRRRPSLVRRNRPLHYQRQLTALAVNDPLLRARILSKELGKESIPHTSGRRHLVEQKRSERALSANDKEAAEKKETATEDKNANEPVVSFSATLQQCSTLTQFFTGYMSLCFTTLLTH